MFWIQFNGIYYFPWEILSSSKLNLFFPLYYIYLLLYIPKIKAFFHSCKKIIKENCSCLATFDAVFPTCCIQWWWKQKIWSIHVFLEIASFLTHWMTIEWQLLPLRSSICSLSVQSLRKELAWSKEQGCLPPGFTLPGALKMQGPTEQKNMVAVILLEGCPSVKSTAAVLSRCYEVHCEVSLSNT